ncbi:CRIB domain-containing protein RIC10 [Sesamum angolense]|uniref:CRIB domain-containing protein RIC10 n=1 Tax=Sesamum angolense TaxID=2727404 RepID=A0AAE1W4T7_9LAMI|nr:CRIB domain-containing protein RIC10 [Sesamum angolense]
MGIKGEQFNPVAEMGTKMKGIYKGFKYTLSQIFVVKEREMEIGYPTDVKHVAHIGWDGPSGNAPTWMNEFKTGPDFAAMSIGNSGSALSPWSSQEAEQNVEKFFKRVGDLVNDDGTWTGFWCMGSYAVKCEVLDLQEYHQVLSQNT